MSRLCFIGAGRHAQANVLPAALAAGVEVAGIATRHQESALAATARFGGNPYDDWRHMLDAEACDGVVVVAQPADQLALTMACTAMKKPVWVEKPLGCTAMQAAQAAEAAQKTGTPVMVGFMKRYAPAYLELQRLIESGELGRPRSFEVFFGVDSAAFCPTTEDFVLLAAVHMIDLMRMLFGEVAEVRGLEASVGGEVNLCLALRFESGVAGTFNANGMSAWSREQERVTITFDNGFACAEDLQRVTVHKSGGAGPLGEVDTVLSGTNSPATGTLRDLRMRGFTGEFEHFAACLTSGSPPNTSAADNIKTMALCETILHATR